MSEILKLSEYEFDIIRKPGKQHVNADVLSRHVGAINGTREVRQETNDLEMSLSVIAQEQSMDENCIRLRAQVNEDQPLGFTDMSMESWFTSKQMVENAYSCPRPLYPA
jgi:hypothetical protein